MEWNSRSARRMPCARHLDQDQQTAWDLTQSRDGGSGRIDISVRAMTGGRYRRHAAVWNRWHQRARRPREWLPSGASEAFFSPINEGASERALATGSHDGRRWNIDVVAHVLNKNTVLRWRPIIDTRKEARVVLSAKFRVVESAATCESRSEKAGGECCAGQGPHCDEITKTHNSSNLGTEMDFINNLPVRQEQGPGKVVR